MSQSSLPHFLLNIVSRIEYHYIFIIILFVSVFSIEALFLENTFQITLGLGGTSRLHKSQNSSQECVVL